MQGSNDYKIYELSEFTNDSSFPFFIQYGRHDNELFIHSHKDFSELTIVLSGEACHIVEDEKMPVKKRRCIYCTRRYKTRVYRHA